MVEKYKLYCESSQECFDAMMASEEITVRGRHNNHEGDYVGIPLGMYIIAKSGFAWKISMYITKEFITKEISVVFRNKK